MPIDSWQEIYQHISFIQMQRGNGTLVDPLATVDALLGILLQIVEKHLDSR